MPIIIYYYYLCLANEYLSTVVPKQDIAVMCKNNKKIRFRNCYMLNKIIIITQVTL